MKKLRKRECRQMIGQITTATMGPPGVFMEASGLWIGHRLTD
jgi:hypothetical protein